jgi:GcrA cell cycle regulator
MDGWTDARVESATQLWRDGLSASQIAGEIGGKLTRNAVIGKINRLGLGRKDQPRESRAINLTRPPRSPSQPKAKSRAARMVAKAVLPDPGLPEYLTLVPADQPDSLNIPLVELRSTHCREITGQGGDGLATYCGHEKSPRGGSYCGFHRARNYAAPQPRPTPRAWS